jgi:hypothetical protein
MTKTTFNPKRDLPYLAAIAQTAQYTHAGYVFMGWAGAIQGFLIGALVSMTVAYASSQIIDNTAKARRGWSFAFMFILLVISPIVVGTASYLKLPFSGIWAGVVAGVWGIIPDFSIALGGFVAGRGMVKQDAEQTAPPAKRPKAEPKQAVPLYSCSQCGWTSTEAERSGRDAQKSYNGHMLKHKPIRIDQTLLIKKGDK